MKTIYKLSTRFSRTFILLLLLAGNAFFANAQYNSKENNIWAFGYHASLDFTNGAPVLLSPSPAVDGNGVGFGSVCDASGNLLFYTQGHDVWDKNGTLMPNGSAIFPVVGRLSPYSAPQGSVIVPVVGNPNQYYLFSLEAASNSPFQFGTDLNVSRLWYSVIDMTLNNGMGDIVPGMKGIAMDSGLCGNMVAVRGSHCDIWLITHEMENTVFKAYDITTSGISTQPVTSTVGNITGTYRYDQSNMQFSPDGHRLALLSIGRGLSGIGLELYDFDPATGSLSNAILADGSISGVGVAFSPDGTKLYAVGVDNSTYAYSMYQYDITQTTGTAIKNSRYIVAAAQYLDMRLGPDGKIYHIQDVSNIDVINDPNQSGAACNFVAKAITAPTGVQFMQHFPNECVKAVPMGTVYDKILDTMVCPNSNSFTLYAPAGSSGFLWDDGSTDSARTVTEAGKYYVQTSTFCATHIDTFVVSLFSMPSAAISVNGSVLSTTASYATYQWYLNDTLLQGAISSSLTVTQNGKYTVKVTNSNGCSDSASYTVSNITGIGSIQNTGARVTIYPNPATNVVHIVSPVAIRTVISGIDGKTLIQQDKATDIDISHLSAGVYVLRVMDDKGQLLHMEKLVKAIQ